MEKMLKNLIDSPQLIVVSVVVGVILGFYYLDQMNDDLVAYCMTHHQTNDIEVVDGRKFCEVGDRYSYDKRWIDVTDKLNSEER